MRARTISNEYLQVLGLGMLEKALSNELFQFGLAELFVMHCHVVTQ